MALYKDERLLFYQQMSFFTVVAELNILCLIRVVELPVMLKYRMVAKIDYIANIK